MAAWCAATMLMTMPGISVLAGEMEDESIVTVAEDPYPAADADDALDEGETDAEVPAEEVFDEEDVSVEAETVHQENPEEIVGVTTVTVGDGVTATFDENTGAVEFYSNGGTLWKDWVDKIGIESKLITSIKVKSGTVYLPADSTKIFYGCNMTSFDLSRFNTSKVTDMDCMFGCCEYLTSLNLSNIDTSNVTDMRYMFVECESLINLDLSRFNTSQVTDMDGMFAGCRSLTNLDLSGFNTSKVNWMQQTFCQCESLTNLDLSGLNTSLVKDMSYMFEGCGSLTNLNLNGFNTSNVTNMTCMFSGCKSLTKLDLSSFVTSNVTKMSAMFLYCDSLTNLDLSSFDTSNVTDTDYMFSYYMSWSLQILKTPKKHIKSGVTLPDIMYDSSGTSYTELPVLTKSIVLTRKIDVSKCSVTLSPSSYTYDGNVKKPSVTVKSGTNTLRNNTDYVAAYSNNINAGTATVTITGVGTCTGTTSRTFTIAKATPTLQFASASLSKKTGDAAFTNTLTKTTDGAVTFKSSNTSVATVNSTSGMVAVKGAGTTTITATAAEGTNYKAGSASYSLNVVGETVYYTVTYDANGGTGTPSSQTKQKNVALTLSSAKPAKQYVIRYNSNGGSVSPASKSISCTFNNWNTAKNGTGTSYAPGGSYTANADATLYAQWSNPKAGTLATPTRSGYVFTGWFTSATGGNQISSSSVVSGNITIYAHWTDPYNLGDETYSFSNYSDSDSWGGHCFGMSVTSSGYENKLLDIKRIGGNENTPLYSFRNTQIVRQPICYYQAIQGSYSSRAIVAGGSAYLSGRHNITSDWPAVVNFVKDHKYDGTGLLQIGFRKENQGGHAINFLYYQNVNGQDRIYAYDNNFPDREVYFYQNAYGNIVEAPVQTFNGAIDCIALRDVRKYFNSVGDFDSRYVVYMAKDAAEVEGYTYSFVEDGSAGGDYIMYEIPSDRKKITINPKKDNADFIYMGTEYSFGKITDETRGELTFSTLDETSGSTNERFVIYEGKPAVYRFSDVQDPNHAYFKAIYWAADAGITKGYSDGTFGINRSCTRGEMMMFLWRYVGKPAPKNVSKSPFKDVPKTHTFYKAILWGSQKGITKGYSDGTFGINRNVSRGECMMFLWRLKGKPAPKAVAKAPFPDVPKSHVFYKAVLWGYQKKITTGFTSGKLKGKFGVNENCSRGQIVTFLYRAK